MAKYNRWTRMCDEERDELFLKKKLKAYRHKVSSCQTYIRKFDFTRSALKERIALLNLQLEQHVNAIEGTAIIHILALRKVKEYELKLADSLDDLDLVLETMSKAEKIALLQKEIAKLIETANV